MAWTSPRLWVTGELVTASLMNTYLSDDFAYLKDAPTFDGAVTITGAATLSSTLTASALVDLSGASAGQIKFPATQNASTNVNTLDDYEEGTWTPVLGGSGGTAGQVYVLQKGKYVKIGKQVWVSFYIQLSTLGTVTTNAQIQGLPFTVENTANQFISATIGYWENLTSTLVTMTGLANPNTTAITLFGATAAANKVSNLAQADFANTTILGGAMTFAATA